MPPHLEPSTQQPRRSRGLVGIGTGRVPRARTSLSIVGPLLLMHQAVARVRVHVMCGMRHPSPFNTTAASRCCGGSVRTVPVDLVASPGAVGVAHVELPGTAVSRRTQTSNLV